MRKLFLSLFLIFSVFSAPCAANNATDIYLLAKTESVSELKKVENIDVVDSNGNTALCSAIKDGDIDAYNLLKNVGANIEHKCVKKIPAEQYEHFLTKVASANKSWSFLGLGKWGWTAIGVGVAGGAVAAGMGGGSGGGGSDSASGYNTGINDNNGAGNNNDQQNPCESDSYVYEYSDVCPDGWQIGSSCTYYGTKTITKYSCDQPVSCPSNYTVSCFFGYIPTENTCRSGDEIYVECVFDAENYIKQDEQIYSKLNCGNGTQTGNTCTCNYGYVFNSNTCVFDDMNYIEQGGQVYLKLNCGNGTQIGNMCNCSYGYVFNNNTCMFDDVNYIEQGGQIYLKLDCDVGTQIGNACVNNSEIVIDNASSASTDAVYGMHSENNITNADSGIINIKNTYNAYGMQTSGSGSVALNEGKIYIDNTNLSYSINADAYGISVGDGALATNTDTGEIKITNATNTHSATGMYANDATLTNDGTISIENTSSGSLSSVCGMRINTKTNSDEMYHAVNNGTIVLKDISGTTSFSTGMAGNGSNFNLYITNNGAITIENSRNPVAMSGSNAVFTNNGTITIENSADSIGIRTSNAIINNNGEIIINNIYTSTTMRGIWAFNSIVNNTGSIVINTGSYYNVNGIYADGSSTIVRNTGTISVKGNSCTGNACSSNSRFILLVNGATFENSGIMSAPKINLNSMDGKVVAKSGSSFVVDNELSGNLHISNDVVTSGNQTTYIAQNMIDAGDTSGLNLISDSAMFDASLVGKDVVMQMKDFDSLTDNKSSSAFLKNNYDKGNGSNLFAALKSMDNMTAFKGALSGFTGLNTFTQFAHEDLSAMREISFSMNNKLFENSGRDSFDISDSMGYFSFSDGHNGGSGQYGISSDKINDNWKLGYGMAMANINTNDGDGMYRQNKMWLFYMPATYTNDNIELVIVPKAGFARSEYSRRGFNNMNYDGYIEKRIVGLMNDLRYPLTLGNWTFAPDLAFNTIVYTQDGQEDGNEYALIIPHDNTVSVETGLGLYGKYETTLSDGSRLNFTTGIMEYREFGDTYNIKLGMRGMDGTFDLYNNDYKYRGALNVGLDYTTGRLHLYGNTQYFMDNANYMNFKGGVSYKF